MRVLKGAEAETLDLAFSPDGRAISAGYARFHGVYLWNLEAATPAPVRLDAELLYVGGGLQFSADCRSLSWRSTDGRRVYHRDTREFTDHSFAVAALTHGTYASANGSRIVSQHGLPRHCLMGWRWADSNWVRTWTVSIADKAVESLVMSADGLLLALLSRSALGERWSEKPRQVEVWNGATGRVLGEGEYPYSYAPMLLFSPDGHQLVGMNDMTLLVWSVPQLGQPRLVRNDSRKDFTAIAYHPSGRQLYATSNDATVHVFDTATWERTGRFTWKIGKLKAVAVSPDGTLAAVGGENGDIVIWDVDV